MKKWQREELEEIPCDFCGSRRISLEFIRADAMRVVECSDCGLAYLSPRPRAEFIPKLYREDYFTGASAARGEGGLSCNVHSFGHRPTDNQPYLPRPIEIINARYGGFQNKDVLEVGCATGDLLLEVKNAGARTKGVELSEFAAEIARKRKLDVKTGTIVDIAASHSKFDVLLAFEVIEHVLSPTQFLTDVARVLRPGGIFLVSTPNYACAKRFGNAWYGFNASFEHIYFYSLSILTEMSQKAGFSLRYWETSTVSGGPDYSSSFLRLQVERLLNLLFFIKEVGIYRTTKAILKRQYGYYPYGVGHTLLAVFEKCAG